MTGSAGGRRWEKDIKKRWRATGVVNEKEGSVADL
jgi:hypothetical protein